MDAQWSNFQKGMEAYQLPASTMKPVVPYQTSSSDIGVSGFQDLKPANPDIQAQYDAMSPNWNGITGSNPSVYRSIATSENAPANLQSK
jgi:membrane peptidoglycan carboxypeptidase